MKTPFQLIQATCVLAILSLWLAKAHAEFTWVINNGTIEITRGCPSSPGAVVIPETIDGLPVTKIGAQAFRECTSLTSVVIPDSVTSMGVGAFSYCTNLLTVKLSENLGALGVGAFTHCESLTSVTIPASVTTIIGNSFDQTGAFHGCPLTTVFFQGDAPRLLLAGAFNSTNMTAYYLPGTSGWGPTFADRPTAPWALPEPVILKSAPGVGVQPYGFSFRISWATNSPVVVEASPSLSAPEWSPLSTNNLVNGWLDFTDPQWADRPHRFYRVRGP